MAKKQFIDPEKYDQFIYEQQNLPGKNTGRAPYDVVVSSKSVMLLLKYIEPDLKFKRFSMTIAAREALLQAVNDLRSAVGRPKFSGIYGKEHLAHKENARIAKKERDVHDF